MGSVRVVVVGRGECYHPVAKQGHGCCVPIEGSIEFLAGGKHVVLRCAEHVEGLLHLQEESAPQLEGTVFINGCDGGDNVVLGRLHRWLTCVDLVIVRRHNLDWDFLGRNVVLACAGALVVKVVEGCLVALLFELGTCTLECGDHACVFS